MPEPRDFHLGADVVDSEGGEGRSVIVEQVGFDPTHRPPPDKPY